MSIRQRTAVASAGCLAVYSAASAGLMALISDGLGVAAGGTPGLDDLLATTAAAAAQVVLSALLVTVLLALVAVTGSGAGRRHRLARRLTPACARRLAALLLGAGLAAGSSLTGGPATASGVAPAPPPVAAEVESIPDLEPLPQPVPALQPLTVLEPLPGLAELDRPAPALPGWTPDRPAGRRSAGAARHTSLLLAAAAPGRAVLDEVVVRRGDTLWGIAARQLGPDASDAEIATEWPRWYRANRELIGPSPDHLLPGQRLRPPAG